jgi:hypothetical protein
MARFCDPIPAEQVAKDSQLPQMRDDAGNKQPRLSRRSQRLRGKAPLSISVFRAMLPGARQDRLPRSLVGFIGL